MEDVIFVRQRGYVKYSLLGRGTFGKVYLVRDKEEKYLYALKQINIENHSDAAAIQREFLAMLTSLRHRHIIHLFDCAIAKSSKSQLVANFIMEYCMGGTLNNKLSIPNSQIVNLKWMIQIADAVAFLHHRGIIHRDLKADNVLLTASNNVKLCDLGLASISLTIQPKRFVYSSELETEQVGTPCFWSPELLDGAKHCEASDVFALGHILYAIKERCCIDRKPSKVCKLYGAFVKTERYGVISLGQAQKRARPCYLVFSADKGTVDKGIRTITMATLSHRFESRPCSEHVFQYLKSTARLLVEIKRQNLATGEVKYREFKSN